MLPQVWSADMTTITYNDYSDKVKHQGGRFFYDWPHRRQKQDFGTTALLYVGANASEPGHKSKFYFVAFGFACFYVDTEDPITHVDIGEPPALWDTRGPGWPLMLPPQGFSCPRYRSCIHDGTGPQHALAPSMHGPPVMA